MDTLNLVGIGILALIISSVSLNKKIKEMKKNSWIFLPLFVIASYVLSFIFTIIFCFIVVLSPETFADFTWGFLVFSCWIMEFVFSKFILKYRNPPSKVKLSKKLVDFLVSIQVLREDK